VLRREASLQILLLGIQLLAMNLSYLMNACPNLPEILKNLLVIVSKIDHFFSDPGYGRLEVHDPLSVVHRRDCERIRRIVTAVLVLRVLREVLLGV
jgi:hypothetical protein